MHIEASSALGWFVVAASITACGGRANAPPTSARTEPSATVDNVVTVPAPTAPAPWRWESSLGLELEVPAAWSINDIGCNMSEAPTVARARGAQLGCLTLESPTKQVIELSSYSERYPVTVPEGLVSRAVTLGAHSAERAEGQAKDGRFVGWLRVPQLRAVVSMRVHEQATMQHVLDSVRVIDVDHNGCPTRRDDTRLKPPAAARSLVPADTATIALCYYEQADVLGASARLEANDATRVATALNAAAPHRNPDRPERECLRPAQPQKPDLLLIASSPSDNAAVQLGFSGCTGRGLHNGRNDGLITQSLLSELMAPLHSGYGSDLLPP